MVVSAACARSSLALFGCRHWTALVIPAQCTLSSATMMTGLGVCMCGSTGAGMYEAFLLPHSLLSSPPSPQARPRRRCCCCVLRAQIRACISSAVPVFLLCFFPAHARAHSADDPPQQGCCSTLNPRPSRQPTVRRLPGPPSRLHAIAHSRTLARSPTAPSCSSPAMTRRIVYGVSLLLTVAGMPTTTTTITTTMHNAYAPSNGRLTRISSSQRPS